MVLQEALDESEAVAVDALDKAGRPGAELSESRAALEAMASEAPSDFS